MVSTGLVGTKQKSSVDIQSTRRTAPPLTSVEEAEALQVAENGGGFAAQEVEASRDVLLHGEAAELAHILVATQQGSLDGHRHLRSLWQSSRSTDSPTAPSVCRKICDAAFYFLFTSAVGIFDVCGSKELKRFWLVLNKKPRPPRLRQ